MKIKVEKRWYYVLEVDSREKREKWGRKSEGRWSDPFIFGKEVLIELSYQRREERDGIVRARIFPNTVDRSKDESVNQTKAFFIFIINN